MASVRWLRQPGGGSLLNDVLAGATGGLQSYNDNQARQFAVDTSVRRERLAQGQHRQNLQDQADLIEFREAVKRASEEDGAQYKRLARGTEVKQLKASLGGQWTPDHEAAAEVYRLTGDHGALKQVFAPKDPNKEAYQQLRNAGVAASTQYTNARVAALQAKEARDAGVRQDLATGVDDAVRRDLLDTTDAYFNDTGDNAGPDAGMSRGQYDEDVRTSMANLQSGRSAAMLGKSYQFERPRMVRPEHGTDPDTKRRLDEAEQRRADQAATADLRAYAKQLAAEANDVDLSDDELKAKKAELAKIQAALGRRAKAHLGIDDDTPASTDMSAVTNWWRGGGVALDRPTTPSQAGGFDYRRFALDELEKKRRK